MRWSNLFIPTLREEPAQVESPGHRLLLRAAYIRQLSSGLYSLLPLAQFVRRKIIKIIQEEMSEISGQEFCLPSLLPTSLLEESGRKEDLGEILFKLLDKKGSEYALAPTHEELFTVIARQEIRSYKELPQVWYQIRSKFRDELRPRGGLLRLREFTMKDSYSFDKDEPSALLSFNRHKEAYKKIFSRVGLSPVAARACSAAMGGSQSLEFLLPLNQGEDTLVSCASCGYAANLECAESNLSEPLSDCSGGLLSEFATPGIRTIKQLEEFCPEAKAGKQIKTLVYKYDNGLVLALLRGDQELSESKLKERLKTRALQAATDREIYSAMGAHPGSLGACGIEYGASNSIKTIIADKSLRAAKNMFTGANKDDFHLKCVDTDRDMSIAAFSDLHVVKAGESCTECGSPLKTQNALELGHIFYLSTFYSQSMQACFLDPEGKKQAFHMGSYGVGIERLMAAVAEIYHDEAGLKWPVLIAPFQLIILPVKVQDETQMSLALEIYARLKASGLDVLLDDRDERAGVKFKDADLIGIPYRVTVGKRAADGIVEFFNRSDGSKQELPSGQIFSQVTGYRR